MLTRNTELTYSENGVWVTMRLTSRMPVTASSPAIGARRHAEERSAGAVVVAGTALATGATLGSNSATAAAQAAHSTAAPMLIQRKLAWSRIRPPITAPASDPILVDTCR
ncbi:hypothetical protein D3C72_1890340 [compost metagenome]